MVGSAPMFGAPPVCTLVKAQHGADVVLCCVERVAFFYCCWGFLFVCLFSEMYQII